MTSIWTSPSAWRRTRDRDARRGLTRTGSFGSPCAALWCWASPDHVASSSELGCRRVGEHLKRSIRLGFIESVEGGGGNSSGRVYVIDDRVQRVKCGRAESVIDQLLCRGSGCGGRTLSYYAAARSTEIIIPDVTQANTPPPTPRSCFKVSKRVLVENRGVVGKISLTAFGKRAVWCWNHTFYGASEL